MTLTRLALALIVATSLTACTENDPAPPSASAVQDAQNARDTQAVAASWSPATATESAPSARHENALVAIGHQLFLLGGRGERPLDILDLQTGQWRTGAAPPMEMHHTQAVAFDGRLYVVGALQGPPPEEDVIARVLIYDPAGDRWSEGPEIPADRRRGAGGLIVHDGTFYLVGGNRLGHLAGSVPWLDAFDPRTGAWTRLPDAPQARDHFHAAVLDGKIYAPGGRVPVEGQAEWPVSVTHMDVYDIASQRWTTVQDPIPTPRAGVSVVAAGGLILTLGGESERQATAHAEVEAYDPAADAWITLPALPIQRHGTQAVLVDDAVHVVAGSRNRGGGPELTDHWILQGL